MKYLMTLVFSNLLCEFLALTLVKFNTSLLMYLFLFVPLVLVCLDLYLKKSNYIDILEAITYMALFICSIFFWTDDIFKSYFIIDGFSLTAIAFLLLTIIFSFILPKTNPNNSLGIRTHLTLNYPEIWKKTQKMTSYYMVWTFIPLFLLIFYLSGWIRFIFCTIIIFIPLIMGAIYSNIIGRKIVKYEEYRDEKDYAEQIKKEQGGFNIQGSKDE